MMDTYSPIIFGDFSEREQQLYFSEESVKSSGVEFPELWNILFISSSAYDEQHFETVQDVVSSVESVEDYAEADELNASSEVVSKELTTLASVNQVSGNIEVESSSSKPNAVQTSQAPISSFEEQKFEHESVPENVLVHNEIVENGVTPEGQEVRVAHQSDPTGPANVVTVGTKTMMTTSTRTVESQHEGVKSSWADLFKTKSSSKPQGPLPQVKVLEPQHVVENNLEDGSKSQKDQFQHYFMDVLKKISLTNQVPSLQPRGLKNNGNWCYINSTLQVLLFCPSFYHFLMKFKLKTERGTSSTPILDALVLFASQFSDMPHKQSAGKSRDSNKQEVMMGMPFEPKNVYKLLTQVKTSLSQQGKQEDAEEFLSCILNGLHDEMVQLAAHGDKPQEESNSLLLHDVGDWEQVGPRNRSTITRKATLSKSPVAAMFGGYLRSSLVQHGVKESASIQPFFTIQLDLRGEVNTVQQAFNNFFRVEEVEGFQCDKSKTEVEVSKKWTLDTLPVVLVLHLKRFVVNKHGCEKLTKKVSYEPQLQIPSDTLSKVVKVRSKNMMTYKLFAVTYHHGKNLHGGHYTSDISHPAVGWLRADDMNVRTVPSKFVFNPLSNRDPYLLYYCRGDISN